VASEGVSTTEEAECSSSAVRHWQSLQPCSSCCSRRLAASLEMPEAAPGVSGEISNQIRGVETYDNPFDGREVELPDDYRYAWVNPNVGSTLDWRLLRPAH